MKNMQNKSKNIQIKLDKGSEIWYSNKAVGTIATQHSQAVKKLLKKAKKVLDKRAVSVVR